MTNIPWLVASVGILATMVLVGGFYFGSRAMKTGIKRQFYAVLALGISICLVGVFLMVTGEPIIGADHTGIATIAGIAGIGIIGLSAVLYTSSYRRTMH